MHRYRVLACVQTGWRSAAALSGLGDICHRLMLRHLEIESGSIGKIKKACFQRKTFDFVPPNSELQRQVPQTGRIPETHYRYSHSTAATLVLLRSMSLIPFVPCYVPSI